MAHLRRRRSSAGASLVQQRETLSLNPQEDEKDREASKQLLNDPIQRERVESLWFAVLQSGRCLEREECNSTRFRDFLLRSKLATTEREVLFGLQFFDGLALNVETLDFLSFVKCLFRIALDRCDPHEKGDRLHSFGELWKKYCSPFLEEVRRVHRVYGAGSDELYLDHADVDRVLYVYDTVFERLFNRYRDSDSHENRELTLQQSQILQNYVELQELREMAKEFNFFPKFISFYAISVAAQCACFGRLVVDPRRQAAGRQSDIETQLSDTAIADPRFQMTLPELSDEAKSGAVLDEGGQRSVNPLFVEMMPKEYLTDEPLLDKPRFMSAVVRMAQALYNPHGDENDSSSSTSDPNEYHKRLPTVAARIEKMLRTMAPTYEKIFGRTMESDCDYSEQGIPVLLSGSRHAALSPFLVPMEGGCELTISGANFCEKRGAFVRFGEKGWWKVVRCKQVNRRKVVVITPPMSPRDVEVESGFVKGCHVVTICLVAHVPVECSNNRTDYSSSDPEQVLKFADRLPEYTIPLDLTEKLMRTFTSACAMGNKYGTSNFMTKESWKKLKQVYRIVEIPMQLGEPLPESSEAFQEQARRQQASASGAGSNMETFFPKFGDFREGYSELVVDFRSYLRLLGRCFYSELGPELWYTRYAEVADIPFTAEVAQRVVAPVETDEFTSARNFLDEVEKRVTLELDVFMGPVLCGHISSVPGRGLSTRTSGVPVHLSGHLTFSYEHYSDMNTERPILAHAEVSKSVYHFIHRLLSSGFDLAAFHPHGPSKRRPVGRCWHIADETDERIGVVWDYEGWFSCTEWQPAEQELFHKAINLHLYVPNDDDRLVHAYMAFSKARDIAHLRALLTAEGRGWSLSTALYHAPQTEAAIAGVQ